MIRGVESIKNAIYFNQYEIANLILSSLLVTSDHPAANEMLLMAIDQGDTKFVKLLLDFHNIIPPEIAKSAFKKVHDYSIVNKLEIYKLLLSDERIVNCLSNETKNLSEKKFEYTKIVSFNKMRLFYCASNDVSHVFNYIPKEIIAKIGKNHYEAVFSHDSILETGEKRLAELSRKSYK